MIANERNASLELNHQEKRVCKIARLLQMPNSTAIKIEFQKQSRDSRSFDMKKTDREEAEKGL